MRVPASGGSLGRPEAPQNHLITNRWPTETCVLRDWWASCCRSCGRRGCQRFILTGRQLFGWKLSVLLVTNVGFNLSLVLSASLIEHLLWAGIFLRLLQSAFWLYLRRLMQSSKINNLIFLRKSIARDICFQFAHKVKNAWNHSLISWTFVGLLLEKNWWLTGSGDRFPWLEVTWPQKTF